MLGERLPWRSKRRARGTQSPRMMPYFSRRSGAIAALAWSLLSLHCSSADPLPSSALPTSEAGADAPCSEAETPCFDADASPTDTASTDASLHPPPAESGFVDVPAQATSLRTPSRLFYSFQPTQSADDKPKPLLVFFNGGPGSATSTCLLSYGTGPFTIGHPGTGDDSPRVNERTRARDGDMVRGDAKWGAGELSLLRHPTRFVPRKSRRPPNILYATSRL